MNTFVKNNSLLITKKNTIDWTPSELGQSLALWLDADDISTIILDGTNLSQWLDKSGNSYHASQTTPTNRPIYNPAGLNNKPIIIFDGINDFLRANEAAVSIGKGSFTLLSVCRFPTKVGFFMVISTTNTRGYAQRSGINTFRSYFGDLPVSPPNMVVVDGSSNILGLQREGFECRSIANGAITSSVTSTIKGSYHLLTLGALASSSSVGGWTDVGHSEIILFKGIVGSETLQKTEGYLAHKWSLQDNLPNTHPYRYEKP